MISVIVGLVCIQLCASAAIASSLIGEWTTEGDPERRLVLKESGSFELNLSGRSTQEEFFIIHLDMTPETGFFGYGITGNLSAGSEVSDPAAHVYRISEPVVSQQLRMSGIWTSTDSSLLLMVKEFEISHVNGTLAMDYMVALVRQELENGALADEAKRASPRHLRE